MSVDDISTEIRIESRGLKKFYGSEKAVNGVDLKIRRSECFGILGPNGAGKTSLMRMLYCHAPVSVGELFVCGLDVQKHALRIKKKIGVVPQENNLDPDFTVLENLLVFARYHKMKMRHAEERAHELLREVQLEDKVDASVETLSGGMKRRLAIARALMSDPEVIVLDEPTVGLDPQARQWIWNLIYEMKERGLTVVLTTHYMDEAERLCDRVAIMNQGVILCEGRPKDLVQEVIGNEVVEFSCASSEMDYYIARIKGRYDYQVSKNRVRLFIRPGQEGKDVLNQVFSENLTIRRSTLDDVFLKIAGQELQS